MPSAFKISPEQQFWMRRAAEARSEALNRQVEVPEDENPFQVYGRGILSHLTRGLVSPEPPPQFDEWDQQVGALPQEEQEAVFARLKRMPRIQRALAVMNDPHTFAAMDPDKLKAAFPDDEYTGTSMNDGRSIGVLNKTTGQVEYHPLPRTTEKLNEGESLVSLAGNPDDPYAAPTATEAFYSRPFSKTEAGGLYGEKQGLTRSGGADPAMAAAMAEGRAKGSGNTNVSISNQQGPLETKTKTDLAGNVLKGASRIRRLDELLSRVDEKHFKLFDRIGYAVTSGASRLGISSSPEAVEAMTDFTLAARQSFDVINETIHDLTGAQLSQFESYRIMNQMPKFGDSVWPAESYPEYRAKLNDVIRDAKLSVAMSNWALYNDTVNPISEIAGRNGVIDSAVLSQIRNAYSLERTKLAQVAIAQVKSQGIDPKSPEGKKAVGSVIVGGLQQRFGVLLD